VQLVDDGPDLPEELLAVQEEGDLVFFCGAGVSSRAGLPGFQDLTERLYRDCAPSRTLQSDSPLDRELYLLEQQVRRKVIVAKINEHLVPPTPTPLVDTHEAIIGLSAADGVSRLVTTNFDTLFEQADPTLRARAAPLLPFRSAGSGRAWSICTE
jgi:NAD-dependent SIR2 family protein deacetylase